jgi:hypothetical protein
MRTLLNSLAVLALLVAALPGCNEKKADAPIPPVPTPRYLSRDIAPPPAGEKADGNTKEIPEKPEPVAVDATKPAEPASEKSSEVKTSDGKTPEELAAEVREAISRLQSKEMGAAAKQPDAAKVAVEPSGKVEMTDIRPADTQIVPVPKVPGEKTPPAKTPVPPTEPVAAPPQGALTLENLTKHYESLAAANPQDVELARSLRFLQFLSGNNAASLEAIPGLAPDEQNLWHWMMASMIAARDRVPGMSRADQAAEVLEDLDRVQAILRKEAPLGLGTVRFCSEILAFGDYRPVENRCFRPGDETKLYAEIKNFVSEKGTDGLYRVRLNVSLSLERPDGTSVLQDSIPNVEDKCRTPRQDFFLRVHFRVPQNVPPGPYVLKVTFEDVAAHKQAGAQLPLEVVP